MMNDQVLLEEMIPELEDFQRKGIFSREEIRSIVKKRRLYESNLRRRIAKRIDFLRYIQYEMNLDLLRKKRKNRLNANNKAYGSSISDFACIRRIHYIYERALQKFKSDEKLWYSFFHFQKLHKSHQSLSRSYARALQFLPTKEWLWIEAAQWEASVKYDIQTSRILYQRGIRINHSSINLWVAFFQTEMNYALKLKNKLLAQKISEEEEEEEKKKKENQKKEELLILDFLNISITIVKNAMKTNLFDFNAIFKFLEVIPTTDSFFDPIVNEIITSLRYYFPLVEDCWKAQAQYLYNRYLAFIMGSQLQQEISHIHEIQAISIGVAVFELAISTIFTDQTQTSQIYEKYISFLYSYLPHDFLQENSISPLVQYLVPLLLELFDRALSATQILSPVIFIWCISINISMSNIKKAKEVCELALKQFPSSLQLHRIFIQLIKKFITSSSDINEEFNINFLTEIIENAINSVSPEDSCFLWIDLFELQLILFSSTEKEHYSSLLSSIHRGILHISSCTGTDRELLKTLALDFVITNISSIDFLHKFCDKDLIRDLPSPSMFLFQQCIAAEMASANPSIERLRMLYEQALQIFGNDDSHYHIWLEYIDLEMHFKNFHEVDMLIWRAKRMLPDVTTFLEELTMRRR